MQRHHPNGLHEARGFEFFPIPNWREIVREGGNVLALEGHNQSRSSSDFSLDPYLVARTGERIVGPIVQAWNAETGQPLWQVRIDGRGSHLEGPAGCAGNGIMFFTGGGSGEAGTGETVAIEPKTGEVLWRTKKAYASMNGTPAYQNGKVYLPGVYKLPMACLSATDGRVVWQRDAARSHWYVDAISLGPDFFTVNNKYQGGAKRWNLSDGTLAGTTSANIQLWGAAHGCGSVVLFSEEMAMSATIAGLYVVDSRTGDVLWKSPGFASYTCPNPIVSNGRIFYCPQVNGVLYCFEPDDSDGR